MRLTRCSLAALLVSLAAMPAFAQVVERAPAFAVRDAQGQLRTLTDFDDRLLVLEWTDEDCEAAAALYEDGALPALQRSVTESGGAWLTAFSTARSKDGFLDSNAAAALQERRNAAATAVLADDTGIMARTYNVSRVPHVIVIDIDGRIAWRAAGDLDVATVTEAIEAAQAREELPPPQQTDEAGCPVPL